MGSVLKALDPTGNNFLGMGNTFGRIAGDVVTGGLGEFARPDSFMLPSQLATPLKLGAFTAGATALGGPAGGIMAGTLGNTLAPSNPGGAFGNQQSPTANALSSLLGGGLGMGLGGAGGSGGMGGSGGSMGNLASLAAGGSLLGYGMSMDPSVKDVNMPNMGNDMGYIDQEMSRLKGLYGQQNDQYGQLAQSQRNQLMQQLTTGPEGEAFRQKYNNLGLLNSGAFNTGLANQFGNLAAQQQQDILGQNIAQTGNLANLDASRLSRQFGLEDQQTQFSIAQAVANAQAQAQKQQAAIGGGSYMLGQSLAPSYGGGAGGAAGGLAGAAGGGSSNSISQLVQSLMGAGKSLGGGISNLFGGLFGGGGSGQPAFPQGQFTTDSYSGDPLSLFGSSLGGGYGMGGGMSSGVMAYPGLQSSDLLRNYGVQNPLV